MPVITDLSLTITPATGLYTNQISDGNITASETPAGSRKAIVLDFNGGDGLYARDLGTIFQWPTKVGTILYVWQPSVIPMPESIYDRATDWDDGGTPGAKFIQGVLVEADSFNNNKTFYLQDSDTQSLRTLNECPIKFNKQTEIAFSCSPFVAHSARLISTDGVEWRVWGSRLVFQPWPETCLVWNTELMSYGNGWQHVRMLNIPYIASQPVTVTLFFDQWPAIILSNILPATPSQFAPVKQKVTVPANKSKLTGFNLSSSAPFRLFKPMLEVWVGIWGRTGLYEIVKPYGGDASDGAKV